MSINAKQTKAWYIKIKISCYSGITSSHLSFINRVVSSSQLHSITFQKTARQAALLLCPTVLISLANIHYFLIYAVSFSFSHPWLAAYYAYCFNFPWQYILLLNLCPSHFYFHTLGWLHTTMLARIYENHSAEQGWEAVNSLQTASVTVHSQLTSQWCSEVCLFAFI